jgi:peptide/nickel transport system substrate-binding protein
VFAYNTRRRHGRARCAAALGAVAAAVVPALTFVPPATASVKAPEIRLSDQTSSGATSLIVGETTAPATLDPRKLDNGGGDLNYAELAYDAFIFDTPRDKFSPDLAVSWREVGTGNTEYMFNLRPNVKFSDGTTLTAQDAVNTITAEMGAGTTCASQLSALTKVTATGPLTVQLNYSLPQSPHSVWQSFSQTYMCGDIVGPQASGTQTDGTGPYMLDASSTITGNKYVYVPNPNYWNKSLRRYSQVTLEVFSSITEELNAIRTGEVDFVSANGPQAAAAAKTPGMKSYMAPFGTLSLWLVDFKGQLVKPLASQRVRQALAYAINRPLLAKQLYGGTASPNDEITVAGYQGYVPRYAHYYNYNPAKAKQLLKEAGYSHGFTFTGIASAAVGYEEISQAVSSQLAGIGVTDKLQQEPTHTQAVAALFSRKYPAFVWGFGAGPLSVGAPLLFGTKALFNPFHNPEPALVRDVDQANALSGAAAAKLYQKAEIANTKQAYEVTLLDLYEVYLLKPGVVSNVNINRHSVIPQGPDIAFWMP